MDNSNLNNNSEKKDKKIKNAVLIVSIIYFLFVLEESQDETRKRFYKLLILISSIFLILTNFEFIKQVINDYIIKYLKGKIFGSINSSNKDNTRKVLEYLKFYF